MCICIKIHLLADSYSIDQWSISSLMTSIIMIYVTIMLTDEPGIAPWWLEISFLILNTLDLSTVSFLETWPSTTFFKSNQSAQTTNVWIISWYTQNCERELKNYFHSNHSLTEISFLILNTLNVWTNSFIMNELLDRKVGSKKEDWPECKTSVSMGMIAATVVWPELICDQYWSQKISL